MASNRDEQERSVSQATATALVALAVLAGFWAGYLYRGQAAGSLTSQASADSHQQHNHDGERAASPFAEHDVQVHLAVLKKDPNNRQALVQLGNIYYDTQRYPEAIQYYTRALELDPKDVNVRTDLGTAFWYSGKPKEAVQHFELALQIEPAYPHTLFNLGVVRLNGLNDPAGAIAAWEKLWATNPGYETEKVKGQLEQARTLLKVKNSTR